VCGRLRPVRALAALAPVAAAAWLGVVNDWLDNNRLDKPHSCAALVVAFTQLGGMSYPQAYSRAPRDIRAAARRTCRRGDATRIRLGMSNATVGAVAGLPRLALSGRGCWVYTTRRICFTHGRVSKIQRVTHG